MLPFFGLYIFVFPRHREEILVHLNSMVEQFDVILQKRLVLFGMGFDNKEPSEDLIDQLDGNSEEVLPIEIETDLASDARDERRPSKDFVKSQSSGQSPGRALGNIPSPSDLPKKLHSRNLTRSNSYETALAEESRLQFTFANFFSDLDVSTAKPLGCFCGLLWDCWFCSALLICRKEINPQIRTRARCAALQRFAAYLVGSTWFNLLFAVIIITNSLHLFGFSFMSL